MKKLFSLLIASLFLLPTPTISTETTLVLTGKEGYEQFKLVSHKLYHDTVPENPNLYHEQVTYGDPELTQVNGLLTPNQNLLIRHVTLNSQQIPIFALANGSFIPARLSVVYDDQIITSKPVQTSYWLEPDFTVYDKPYMLGAQGIPTDLHPYQQVMVSEEAVTHHGVYLKIEDKGWVSKTFLSATDNRMLAVQALLNQEYNRPNLAVYVHQLQTGLTAGIHQDVLMYSASISKLPLLYYLQKQMDQGKIKGTDTLTYLPEVNHFPGAYQPSGSGHLPKEADGKDYTVDQLVQAVAKESDNVATNILAYHLTKQYGKSFDKTITSQLGVSWDMLHRQVSAKTAGQMMGILYKQNGQILELLSDTAFDNQRIARDIEAKVVHKIGDAYDFKHDVAIVYTDSPIIISIFTENASYEDISVIAKRIYDKLK